MAETAVKEAAPAPAAPAPAPAAPDEAKPTLLTEPAKPAVEEKKEAAPAAEEKKAEATKVPEKYELKLPEGSLIGEESLARIAADAKAQGLTAEQAQALVEREHGAVARHVEAQRAAYDATQKGWIEELKSDKELGGDAFPKNVEIAKRAFAEFAPPEFIKWANETGMGNNPWLVRTFFKIGQAMSEDSVIHAGSKTSGTPKSAEEILFPLNELTANNSEVAA